MKQFYENTVGILSYCKIYERNFREKFAYQRKFSYIILMIVLAFTVQLSKGFSMTTDKISQIGSDLRVSIDRRYQDLENRGELHQKFGNDITDVVKEFIPIGISFDDAENILRSAGFQVDPRPAEDVPGTRPGKYNVSARISPYTTKFLSKTSISVHLSPLRPGDYSTVTEVEAGIVTISP